MEHQNHCIIVTSDDDFAFPSSAVVILSCQSFRFFLQLEENIFLGLPGNCALPEKRNPQFPSAECPRKQQFRLKYRRKTDHAPSTCSDSSTSSAELYCCVILRILSFTFPWALAFYLMLNWFYCH